jgi:hypothetical protein
MLAIAFLAAIWLVSLAIEDLRTARFLAFLTLASGAYILVEVAARQPINHSSSCYSRSAFSSSRCSRSASASER